MKRNIIACIAALFGCIALQARDVFEFPEQYMGKKDYTSASLGRGDISGDIKFDCFGMEGNIVIGIDSLVYVQCSNPKTAARLFKEAEKYYGNPEHGYGLEIESNTGEYASVVYSKKLSDKKYINVFVNQKKDTKAVGVAVVEAVISVFDMSTWVNLEEYMEDEEDEEDEDPFVITK